MISPSADKVWFQAWSVSMPRGKNGKESNAVPNPSSIGSKAPAPSRPVGAPGAPEVTGARTPRRAALTPGPLRHRLVLLSDLIGLGLALWASWYYVTFPGTRGFVTVLGTLALGMWALSVMWPSKAPLGGHRYLPVVLTPVAAAILTYGLAAVLDARHPTDGTIAFASVWGAWLILVRLLLGRGGRSIRVLLAGSAVAKDDLSQTKGVDLTFMIEPPNDFRWDVAVMDPSLAYDRDWQQWIAHADLAGIRIMGAASFIEAVTGRVPTAVVSGRWASEMFRIDGAYGPWKRIIDVLVTVALAPVVLVICGIVALIVLLDSGWPVLYMQERAGRAGKSFRIAKFRTMVSSDTAEARFAVHGDPRITRSGSWMRRFRLDELPQFWNVLRGDMSIVGPRPEQRAFVQQFTARIPLYEIRLQVRPGITGWAQVTHGYAGDEDQTREKLRRDLYYIKHMSLWTDLRIVGLTLRTIATGFGGR